MRTLEQCEAIEAVGGRIILMASRALASAAVGAHDYAEVYSSVLRQVREPVILHWLGPMFGSGARSDIGGRVRFRER